MEKKVFILAEHLNDEYEVDFYEEGYTHLRAFHACRPLRISDYLNNGIIPISYKSALKDAKDRVGRLDLLSEDTAGNLYVVELKKDSGYDNAYEQTAQYLDWFEKSEKFKGKNVYGIICLNNPTKELISRVHKDKRMRLFEYQISYTEL